MFPRVRRWRRGYHCRQVEAFLSSVEVSLGGHLPPMAASDIRRAGFELVRHGYAVADVDHHLDALEERVLTLQTAASGRRGRPDPASDEQFLRDELSGPHMRRFPRAGMLRRGYDVDDVDDFIDRVTSVLAGTDEMTVDEARAAGFCPKRGGYDEESVDETLDRVVEWLLVKRRAATDVAHRAARTDVETAGPSA
ncbi:MAG: hypothetical protein QOJ27_3181 [Sphingomonadales bacterium]|jgi:DivIVA domain-containing protein|nr:hypothetical protein [Actinomycetota bacterium]MDQ1670732.1 hypothetical protein [Actinomycetota bacterium]MEA3066572.1 hypothetical protein [Sphingomonadales bacterium]